MKQTLRVFGFLEGISFLALLTVGMPLKYLYGTPTPNKFIGMAHGLLFMAYLGFAYAVAEQSEWPAKKRWAAFLASVLPLGTFWFDHYHLREKP